MSLSNDTLDTLVSHDPGDASVPGVAVAIDPQEAERLGAFAEDALTIEDATQASKGIHRG